MLVSKKKLKPSAGVESVPNSVEPAQKVTFETELALILCGLMMMNSGPRAVPGPEGGDDEFPFKIRGKYVLIMSHFDAACTGATASWVILGA